MYSENLIRSLEEHLQAGGIENCHQEARWLADFIRKSVPGEDPSRLEETADSLVRRRLSGEPLQYILGTVDFYDLELEVGPGVLIPRPETEVLVDLALEKYPGRGPVLDLCTGSGAVVLNLALHHPEASMWGTDISPLALHWAELNQKRLNLGNVTWLTGDLFAALPPDAGPFSLITANPPYVSPEEYRDLEPTVKDFEPRSALLAEEEGLQITRRIIEDAGDHLLPGGWLLIEIGCSQSAAAVELMRKNHYENIKPVQDYTGRMRFITGSKKS